MTIIAWCIALVLCPTVAATSCGFRSFFEQNLQGPGEPPLRLPKAADKTPNTAIGPRLP